MLNCTAEQHIHVQSVIHTLAERKSLGQVICPAVLQLLLQALDSPCLQSRWRELVAPLFLNVVLIAAYTATVHFYDGMPWCVHLPLNGRCHSCDPLTAAAPNQGHSLLLCDREFQLGEMQPA